MNLLAFGHMPEALRGSRDQAQLLPNASSTSLSATTSSEKVSGLLSQAMIALWIIIFSKILESVAELNLVITRYFFRQ